MYPSRNGEAVHDRTDVLLLPDGSIRTKQSCSKSVAGIPAGILRECAEAVPADVLLGDTPVLCVIRKHSVYLYDSNVLVASLLAPPKDWDVPSTFEHRNVVLTVTWQSTTPPSVHVVMASDTSCWDATNYYP